LKNGRRELRIALRRCLQFEVGIEVHCQLASLTLEKLRQLVQRLDIRQLQG